MSAEVRAGGDLASFALAAGCVVPLGAAGMITRADNGKISLLRWSPERLDGHTFAPADVPAALSPPPSQTGPRELALEEFESGFSDSLLPYILSSRTPRALLLPISGESPRSIAWIAKPDRGQLSGDEIARLRSLAASFAPAFDCSERPEAELARLRRLTVVDEMLSALAEVLDLREVFRRMSQIAGEVLPHGNVQAVFVWRYRPPFGSVQLAYQRGTAAFGQRSGQGNTLFVKMTTVF